MSKPFEIVSRFWLETTNLTRIELRGDVVDEAVAALNAHSALVEAAHAVDDWFAGRTYNGPAEREAMATLARKAIALAESTEVKS